MADNFDNYSMKVQARVDLPSNKDIDAQIRKLEKSISKLQISGKLDDSSLKNLSHQLDTLKATVTTANFSPTALTELTNQVNRALQNINIGNINVGGVGNQAQQVGQQIGNNIAQGVANGVGKATTTVKSFSALMDSMKSQKVELNTEGLIDDKKTLDAIKQTYSEFGQVKITNKVFDAGQLQSFKVNIEQVNGELKETRTFMMQLSDNGKFFVFPDDTIKGTEKYVQHLNAAKNATNATGEALNAQNQRLEEQAKYYGKIKEETNHLYSLKQKLLSADELQTAELNKQIKSTKQRITYNNQQLDKKGLRDNSLEREINDLVVAREKQLALSDAKAQDTVNTKAQAQAQREANAVLKEQQALQERVNKIQLSTDITKIENDYKRFGIVSQEVENNLKELKIARENALKAEGTDRASAEIEKYNQKLAETKSSWKELQATQVSMNQRTSQMTTMQEWMRKNQKATKLCGDQVEKLIQECLTCNKVRFDQIKNEFKELQTETGKAGKLGNTLFGGIIEQGKKFLQWTGVTGIVMGVSNAFKDMASNVRELDDSLLELVKVSDLSSDGIEKVTSEAYELGEVVGKTGKQVIDAVTEFKRAGYELGNSMNMAEAALVMTNVAEGINDTADAAGTLISVLKGYNMADSEAMSIVDKMNQASNLNPIGFDEIAEGLERTAGTMAQSGTTIDQTIGLITAGYAQLRNVEKVSTGLITLSARLRGVGEDGEVIDGLSAKLQDDFGKIGVAIENADGSLRSIYEIAQDYSKVLPTLTDKQKQYYAELAAGYSMINRVSSNVQKCA